jgi:hypothetical protein
VTVFSAVSFFNFTGVQTLFLAKRAGPRTSQNS